VQWPALLDKCRVSAVVRLDGSAPVTVGWEGTGPDPTIVLPIEAPATGGGAVGDGAGADEVMRNVVFGDVFGTRSGDKAGLANVGVWARHPTAYDWLRSYLTVERFRALVPETAVLHIDRHELPGILGLNFVIRGFLEDGVASSTDIDPQAKGLGEYLGSRVIPVPASLASGAPPAPAPPTS
jgi:hypothetical protein